MFLAGLGSDTAGSIRMPAAFCGVTGLMPTFGRVPKSGCVPLAYSLDRVGPLARTARDCAAVLVAVAGADPGDPSSAARPAPACTFDDDLTGLRVGVVREGHHPPGNDPALAGCLSTALTILAGLGADVVEVALPYAAELITTTILTATCEGLAYHRGNLASRWSDYTVAARGLLAGGALVSGADYVQAQRVRRAAQQAVDALFRTVDVIVCPTVGVGAPPFDSLAGEAGTQDVDGLFSLVFTMYWNSLSNPVLALPMGQTSAGLPLSTQLAGPVFGEATILRVGDAYQQHTDWHRRVPALVGAATGEAA
jgi:aspartyl-tRNA(Asn)/glutamyl-tRNA(Gln) amidotransferase subunit A